MTRPVKLPELEAELERQTAELSGLLLDACRYALGGGRRTRARLLLEAAHQPGPRATRAAAALEMIHAATLLQDDIFDGGDLRRGRCAAHVRFGKAIAILASDWLLVRSLEMAADVDRQFFRCLSRAGRMMAQAEAHELAPSPSRSLRDAEGQGRAIALGKTAALFGTALCGAAVLRGLGEQQRSRWEQIGVAMGLTYQMVDDCVDLYGSKAEAGKSVDHDLAAGCLTMPLLLGARRLEAQGRPISLDELQAGCLESGERLRLHTAVHSVEIVHEVEALLQGRFASHRRDAALAGLPLPLLEAWLEDLQARLAGCLPYARAGRRSEPAHVPDASQFPVNWRRRA